MSTTTTDWREIDALVQMKYEGKDISLAELEIAYATEDEIKIREIIHSLRKPSAKYTAKIYPLCRVSVTEDILRNRVRRWFEESMLTTHLYNNALQIVKDNEKEKELKKKDEKIKGLEDEVKRVKEDVDSVEVVPKKVKEDKIKVKVSEVVGSSALDSIRVEAPIYAPAAKVKSKIAIRDQIKFEKTSLDPIHASFVPTEDAFYEFPEWTLDFCKLLDNRMNVWLYGGTGSGKSSLLEQVCAIGNLPVLYQSFHEDIKPDSLFGGKELVDGNTVWQDGPITKAYREGLCLLLDEIDGTPPEVLFCLFAVLDRKPLVLADNACEVVMPHPNFRVVATGNTLGRGDDSGSYSGTNVLNRAFLNRFRVWYNVEYPSELIYKKIIMKEGVTEPVAAVVARLAMEINSGANSGVLTETFSLRDAREVSKAAEILDGDIHKALKLTILNRVSVVEQGAINEMYQRLVKNPLKGK